MESKNLIIAIALFAVGQAIIWYQTNSQFLWDWAYDRPFIVALIGVPVSYLFIYATRYTYIAYDGALWPGRLLGFASGMVIMAALTYLYFKEGINIKTGISLVLALTILMVQIFWK